MKFPEANRIVPEMTDRIKSLPLLLYSYIASEMLAPFFASFLILYSVFFLVRLVPLLDVVLDLKIGFADFIRMFSYIFPHMLVYVIPMASMIGVILAFTRLTTERELLALKSCGVSLRQLLPPVIVVALGISMLTAFFSINLIPAGNMAMKQLFFQLAKEKIDKGLQERTFTETLGDLVVYVDHIDENEQWQGVYISDMRNREQPIIIMAQKGELHADIDKMVVTIVLGNGTIHNSSGIDNQTIKFSRYQLNIPLKTPTRVHGEQVTVKDRSSMTLQELRDKANELGPGTEAGIVFLSEYHERLVLPVGCFILTILGLPLGMQSRPGRRGIGIPLGLGFFVLYYILTTTGTILSEELVIPILIGMWFPCVILGAITFVVLKRVEQEKPIVSYWVQNRTMDMYDQFIAPAFRTLVKGMSWLLYWQPGKSREDISGDSRDSMELHANSLERIYHYPGCDFYDCPDCTIRFKNSGVAEDAGFKPCEYCHPGQNSA